MAEIKLELNTTDKSNKTIIIHFSTSSGNKLISGYLVSLFPISSTSLFPTSSGGGRLAGRAAGRPKADLWTIFVLGYYF